VVVVELLGGGDLELPLEPPLEPPLAIIIENVKYIII
jgi:hypothetical protein